MAVCGGPKRKETLPKTKLEMDLYIWILLSVLFLDCAVGPCDSSNATSASVECIMGCKVTDEDSLDCFQSTENFYINQIIVAIDNLSGLEEMIVTWNSTFGKLPSIADSVQVILNRTINYNEGPLDNDYLEPILDVALTQVLQWATLQTDVIEKGPKFSCPLPEDYVNDLWIYLFACMCIVLVLTLVYVSVHVHRLKLELRKKTLL